MTEEHTSTMLTKQCLSTIKYLQNEKNPYFLSPSYQIFTIHQKEKKKVKYYLLQWVQSWQHMLFTSNLNK